MENPGAQAAAAAAAAFRSFSIELWTLFSIGATFTILRTYARVQTVGFKKLRPDDYFVWLGVVSVLRWRDPSALRY